MKLLFVLGTRPEVIKLAPVIRQANRERAGLETEVCLTGQHRDMAAPFLDFFGLTVDHDLHIMQPDQTLSSVAAGVLERLDPILVRSRPDWLIIQGDTTSVLASALAAFHRNIPVAHVEAGLRTWDPAAPFPEEMNRTLTTRLASLHLAPTEWARGNLLREGILDAAIRVTGNPVIDALHYVCDRLDEAGGPPSEVSDPGVRRLILVTGHRRENFGPGLENLCLALRDVVAEFPDVEVVYPVHLNPRVQETARSLLNPVAAGGRLRLEPPLDYLTFVSLLRRSCLVITDSGGVQEEAPALGKPVLCTRDRTERPEGVESGAVRMVGPHRAAIVSAVRNLLTNPEEYDRMARVQSPYGDGHAAERILAALRSA